MSGRPARLGWVRRWGVSIVSLAMGLATLFVFRRGLPHLGWIVGYLLLLWLIVAVLAEARAPLETRGRRFMVGAAEYTIQTLYHNLLLFVLPAYWASATLASLNALFLGGVAAGALVTAVDPLYRALARGRGWIQHAFLGFSIFAALNVALPLVGVQPFTALLGSAALAGLALAPALRREVAGWARAHLASRWWSRLSPWASSGWAAALVPPAPLFLAEKTVGARRRGPRSRWSGCRARCARRRWRSGGAASPSTPRCMRRRACVRPSSMSGGRTARSSPACRCRRCWAAAPRGFAPGRARLIWERRCRDGTRWT